jgi:ParB family chromosome partitioning protein
VKYGLIRPDDRSDMVQAARQAAENGTDEPLVSLPSPKTRPVHSEKLVRCLTAHRVAAVQAELLDRPDVALAAITAHLAQKIFRGNDLYYCRSENVFAISATDSQSELRSAAEDMEASAAWAKLQAERTAWAERLPENLEDIFPWLLAQEQATVLHLLTFVVAVTVTGIYGTEPERQSNEALARALGWT